MNRKASAAPSDTAQAPERTLPVRLGRAKPRASDNGNGPWTLPDPFEYRPPVVRAAQSPSPSPAAASGAVVAVTGAGGFVGSAIVRTLLGAGHSVRACLRATSDRSNLAGLDVEIVDADIMDPAALERAFAGARFVVHAAADYRLWARDPGEIVRTNVEGTRNAMAAARDCGAERIVYTSSVAVLKPRNGVERRATESDGAKPAEAAGIYKRSKVLAEEVVRGFTAGGLPAVIVNPSTPIGPRDLKPTPTGQIVMQAALGRMPAFVNTGLNLAHVDDIARGHLLALERGRIGERYILGGEDVMLSDMLGEIARRRGRKPPKLRLPIAAVLPLAAIAEGVARVTGRPPFVSFDALKMARHRMFFDDAKARRELGYTSRPWQEGIGDALAWFAAAGRIA